MDLGDLTLADFEPLVGDTFMLEGATEVPLAFTLRSATPAGEQPGGRAPFGLIFGGPPQPLLAQAIYRLTHAELGALEIFVVPLGQDEAGTTYQAIFA
jgi:hypothetical protein